ncbi:MAG: type VI-B CRISPR-associated RNA-guided ribonuclease Cas13b [Bacteroidales bacterium]
MKHLIGNKFIFGAYLNTAFDNFNVTCQAIGEKLNIKKQQNIQMYKILADELKTREGNQQITIRAFRKEIDRSFPFFAILDNNQNISYGILIETLGDYLSKLRNFHTHLIHDPYEIIDIAGKDVFTQTELIYDHALRLVRQRMSPDREHLAHLYRLDKNGSKNPDFRYEFFCEKEGRKIFTESGIAYFISLFLSKRDGILLLKKISGFKRGDDIPYRLTTEVFTALRMNLPKQSIKLIHRQSENESLAMDILNEITKCPKELYEHLPDDVRKDFIVTTTQESEDEDGADIIGERIRYKDRYEQQMLRILENDASFDELGFYLYLGNCYLRQYEKDYIDGSIDKRTITTPLYGFAKMKDSFFENVLPHTLDPLAVDSVSVEPEFLSRFGKKIQEDSGIPVTHTSYLESRGEEDKEALFPSVRESYPFYVINDNKIGIKFLGEKNASFFPVFSRDKSGTLKVKNPVPDVWISKYELPAMAFYAYLRNTYPNKINNIKSIKEILSEAKLMYALPKQKNRKPARERVEIALNRYLKETSRQIDRIIKYKETGNYKIGELADELTRDILWLQPSLTDGKDKVTGANFQALQYALARYSYMRGDLRRIFRQANLIDSKNRHPFLSDIDPERSANFLDFYLIYLHKKSKYLKLQKEKLAKGKSNIQFHPVRKLVKEMQQGYQAQIPDATFLGRNLFREYIIQIMNRINPEIRDAINLNSQISCSQLITLYLDMIEGSSSQLFYQDERSYRVRGKKHIFETLKQSKEERELHLDKYYRDPDLKAERREILENERQIRMRQTQDQTLFLWMKKYLPQELHILKEITMRDLNNNLLDQIFHFRVATKFKVISITGNIKLKDYGRIHGLLKQKTVNELICFISKLKKELSIMEDVSLSIEYIEKEVGAFDTLSPSIIALTQKLESKCQQKNYLPTNKEDGGFYNFSVMTDRLKTKNVQLKSCEEIDSTINRIQIIRNCFAHSSYPINNNVNICPFFSVSIEDWNRIIIAPENYRQEHTFACLFKEWFEDRIEKLITAIDQTNVSAQITEPKQELIHLNTNTTNI